MNHSSGSYELLSSRVDEVEKRIYALEHPAEAKTPEVTSIVVPKSLASDAGEAPRQTTSFFPILGRALLGIAGAYVLRSVAAMGLLPQVAVAAVAVVYAFAWLVSGSTRIQSLKLRPAGLCGNIRGDSYRHAVGDHSTFSSFHSSSGSGCSGGVYHARNGDGFAQPQSALCLRSKRHRRNCRSRHRGCDARPIAVRITLLLALLVVEYAKTLDFEQLAWPFIALVADVAIWAMIFIYSGPQNARQEYTYLSTAALVFPACGLFAINGSSVAVSGDPATKEDRRFRHYPSDDRIPAVNLQRTFVCATERKCSPWCFVCHAFSGSIRGEFHASPQARRPS